MRSIKLIAMDLMDTVVRDPFYSVIPQKLNMSIQESIGVLDSSAWIDFESGLIDETTYLRRMFKKEQPLGEHQAKEIRKAIHNDYQFLEGMESLLVDLKRSGIRIWILSNYSSWADVIREKLNLDRFFENYIISYQTGYRKPESKAYKALLKKARIDPKFCLFVDDRPSNVTGAEQVGIDGLLFQNQDNLRVELKARAIL